MGRADAGKISSSRRKRAPKGSGPFPCIIEGCTAKLTRAGDVVRHLQIHDPETVNDNRCSLCRKYRTRQPCNLKSHLRKHDTQAAALDSTGALAEGDVKPVNIRDAIMLTDKKHSIKFEYKSKSRDELRMMAWEAKTAAEERAMLEATAMKFSPTHASPYPEHLRDPFLPTPTFVAHEKIANSSVNQAPLILPPPISVNSGDTWLTPSPAVQCLQRTPPSAHEPSFIASISTPRALEYLPSFQSFGVGISAVTPVRSQRSIYYAPVPTYPYPAHQYPYYRVYESDTLDSNHAAFPPLFEGNSALVASSISGMNHMPFPYANPAPQNASTYQIPLSVYSAHYISTLHEPYHSSLTPEISD